MAEASKDDPPGSGSNFHPGLNRCFPDPSPAVDDVPYERWTQFSGMTHPVSPSHLYWNTFSQPSSPSPSSSDPVVDNSLFDLQSPNFSAYPSYIQDLAQPDAFPYSDTASAYIGDDFVPSPFPEDSGYDTASKEGYELYTDAMKQWQEAGNDFVNTYKPFGMSEVLSQTTTIPEEKTECSKPKTYSDVAKTLKTNPMQKPKEDPDICSKKKTVEPVPKSFKPAVKKSFHSPRLASRPRTTSVDGNQGSVVLPDSKYGLDYFEDMDGSESKGDKSMNSTVTGGEGLSQHHQNRSRQGSTSSVSSGNSGIEEIHLTKLAGKDNSEKTTSSAKFNCDQGKPSHEYVPHPTEKTERVFFDPKRIFQKKEKDSNKVKNDSRHSASGKSSSTVLNNGKPVTASKSSCVPPKKPDCINNDLRDSKKRTNHAAAMNRETRGKGHSVQSEIFLRNGVSPERKQRKDIHTRHDRADTHKHLPFGGNIDWELIDEWFASKVEWFKIGLQRAMSILLTLLLYTLGITMYLVTGCVHLIGVAWIKGWLLLKTKVFKSTFKYDMRSGSADGVRRRAGLEENIILPSTGDEAMKRLLACRGKDPYSILGLRSDSSDDDVKKYYRRQAVLVHPDKNQEPGSEEAFKILGHAFEMIREPTKRQLFDAQMNEAHEAESAMKEFSDLLTKLHEKIQEAANMMRCDSCGGKHKRIPVDRPWYRARFCDRCSNFHSAKEGDVWAETKMLGFLWHYYACIDQHVFDITEWVSCHKEFFKQMQANSHHIFYRIATDRNHGQKHGKSGEQNLEDFINHLFHKASSVNPDGSSPWQQQQQHQQQQQQQPPSGPSTSSAWGSGTSTSSGAKKTRRKKKRH